MDSRRWRKALPGIPVAAVSILAVVANSGASRAVLVIVAAVAAAATACLVVVIHDRRTSRHALSTGRSPTVYAQFALSDLKQAQGILPVSIGRNLKWVSLLTSGYVAGRFGFSDRGIDFYPGRVAVRSGFDQFTIPWSLLSQVIRIPQAVSITDRMVLRTREGDLVADIRSPDVASNELTALLGPPVTGMDAGADCWNVDRTNETG